MQQLKEQEMGTTVLVAVLSIGTLCLILSTMALYLSIQAKIDIEAYKKSTHSIQYVDPFEAAQISEIKKQNSESLEDLRKENKEQLETELPFFSEDYKKQVAL